MRIRPSVLGALLIAALTSAGCSGFSGLMTTLIENRRSPDPCPGSTARVFRPDVRLSALWVGHSTVLIQMDDRIILTDPLFTDHASMLRIRQVEPGIAVDSIPSLDLILISHSHSDHCSLGSLKMLERRFPHAHLAFPEGVEEFLPRFDFPLDRLHMASRETGSAIGETRVIAGMRVTTVRSLHCGGRYGLDGILWDNGGYTGFVIQYKGLTVYFAGDTGYDEATFAEIGRQFKIDLACIPIGPATEPDSIGSPTHVYPLGSLRIFSDLHARYMLPIHYATCDDGWDRNSPAEIFQALLKDKPEVATHVLMPQIGEQVVIKELKGGMAQKQ